MVVHKEFFQLVHELLTQIIVLYIRKTVLPASIATLNTPNVSPYLSTRVRLSASDDEAKT